MAFYFCKMVHDASFSCAGAPLSASGCIATENGGGWWRSLNHLVSQRKYIWRNFETEQLGTAKIDHQGVLDRLLDG
jgi:hypothetical protein